MTDAEIEMVAKALRRGARDRSLMTQALEATYRELLSVCAENLELRAALDGTRPVEVPEPRAVSFGPAHRS